VHIRGQAVFYGVSYEAIKFVRKSFGHGGLCITVLFRGSA
jgi:hypothetical protein